jgi:hypothetical protein
MTDRLSLTNALTDADIDRQNAERIAIEIFDAIHDNRHQGRSTRARAAPGGTI